MLLRIKFFLFLISLCCWSLSLGAQELRIQGIVYTSSKDKVAQGNLLLLDSNLQIQAVHAFQDGAFNLRVHLKTERFLKFVSMGYEALVLNLDSLNRWSEQPLNIRIQLKESVTLLEEIVVSADRNRERDTTTLAIDYGGLSNESTLEDILKKVPNIRVGTDGSIVYKGKSIDKITLNHKPAFEHQNSIALNSLRKGMIEGISIINNYQDDFELVFDKQKERIMNIDLNEAYKNTLFGSLYGGYGYSDKFNGQGELMRFSKAANTFLVSNTNNLGKEVLHSSDISTLFSEGSLYSEQLLDRIASLFTKDENRLHDLRSFTNFTLRKKENNQQANLVGYYLKSRYTSNWTEQLEAPDGSLFQLKENTLSYSGQGYFTKLGYDYRVNDKLILRYQNRLSWLRDYTASGQSIRDAAIHSSRLSSILNRETFFVYNRVEAQHKIKEHLIAKLGFAHYVENGQKPDISLFSSYDNQTLAQHQKNNKQAFKLDGQLDVKVSKAFNPSLKLEAFWDDDGVNVLGEEPQVLRRRSEQQRFGIALGGQQILKYLDYRFDAALNSVRFSRGQASRKLLWPYSLMLKYENKLHAVGFQVSQKTIPVMLSAGINLSLINEGVVNGSVELPFMFTTFQEQELSYAYNNLFSGITYGLNIQRNKIANSLQSNLISALPNNLLVYQRYFVPEIKDLLIDVSASKVLWRYSYPIKTAVLIRYADRKGTYRYQSKDLAIASVGKKIHLTMETLRKDVITLSNSTAFGRDEIQSHQKKTSLYTLENNFKLHAKWGDFMLESGIHYQYYRMENKGQSRVNMDFLISRKRNNFILSIESKHVNQVLGLFSNEGYHNTLSISNGLFARITKTEAMHYAIVALKYNIKP